MVWEKLRKLIIPLIIAKTIIFFIFLFRTEMVTISRDISYSSDDQVESDIDTVDLKRQKLLRIVRNEGEHGISIVLRGKKHNTNHKEKEEIIAVPLVD